MTGVLVMDKPAGWTSHDVVAKVKRAIGAKKVGHLGTLDPIATGALVLVIDGATRHATSLDTGFKEYLSVMKLGEATDTYDREGRAVSGGDISGITREAVESILERFKGRISQVPPMYSAIKSGGRPLYKLARKGIVVEREAREVEVERLELRRFDAPFVEFQLRCSRGTYVRSICHDAGALLGCGAHLFELRRLSCGPFSVDGASTPLDAADSLKERIIPLESALSMAAGLISRKVS